MINMLPGDYVDVIRHSKTGDHLTRWLFSLVAAIVGLLIILLSGWLYLDHQTKNLSQEVANGKTQLEEQDLAGVKKNAEQISKDIKVINQVLGREIRFSELIQQIGKAMPPGTILGGLTLTKVDGAIDLTASAKDYTSGAQIALNLSDPKNELFSRADIVSINCTSSDTAYKCGVSLKALFSKSSQNKFLNVPGKSS
jgi:hypothetical protein